MGYKWLGSMAIDFSSRPSRKPLKSRFTMRRRLPYKTPWLTELPIPPSWFVGTNIEWPVYKWLLDHNYEEGRDFMFQVDIAGGKMSYGGLVADFLILDRVPMIDIEVEGAHWHAMTYAQEGKEIEDKVRLENQGFIVVRIVERDVMQNLDYAMENAVQGIQVSEDL
jgi:hypothetical protein